MKLVRLDASNVKGLTFTLHFSPMAMFVGSNFAGKSARTDAIRLLLLGHLPELGKLPRATFGLASGRDMEVRGTFDNGETISRRWFLKGDTVKLEESIPPSLETVGAELLVMLNAETYFALSERERVNYVFANIPLQDDNTVEAIELSFVRELRGTEGLKSEAIDRFLWEFQTAKEHVAPSRDTVQEFLESSVEWVDGWKKAAKTEAAVMEKTAQGLAYLRTQDNAREDELPKLEKAIEEKKRGIAELMEDKARKWQAVEHARTVKRRRAQLQMELDGRVRLIAQRDTYSARVDSIRQAMDKLPAVDVETLRQLQTTDREAALAVRDLERDMRDVTDGITRNEKDLAELDAKTRCAYCGATGDGWKELKRGEIMSALAGLKTKHTQAIEHVRKVREHAQANARRLLDANNAIGLRSGKERELTVATDSLRSAERSLAATDGTAAELGRLEEPNLAELERVVDEVQTRLNVANDELSNQDRQRRALIGRQHDLKRLAEAEKSRDNAKESEEVAKAAVAILRTSQAKMVQEAFSPLLAAANYFTRDILRTPLALHEGEIGTWREGTWVGHKTFSGAEKRLAYVAMQAALASRSPFRLMILDEMGTIDDGNAMKVARRIGEALEAGRLDQFVGVDTGRGILYTHEAEFSGFHLNLEAVNS